MDCTHCEPALLDLCYGELTLAQERDVRAHISECPTCKKALSRLEAGQALARHLPDEAPPHELTERILRDAQAHLRRRGTPLERFQGYLESMARIAMTRQVAMATLSLLIVFVGLWSIPELTHRREARTAVVVESTSHDGEAGSSRELAAGPAAAAAPATLQPEKEQKQLGRAARSGGAVSESSARKAAAEVATKRAERADKGRGSSAASPVAQRTQSKAEARRRRFAEPPPEPTRAAETADAPALAEADRELLARAAPKAAAPAANAVAESRPAAGAALDTLSDSRGDDRVAAKPASPATLEDVFQAAVERYRAEDYGAAAQLFARMLESSAPSAQRAAALLFLARSERELGRCDRAIRAYETLVRSYGSAQQSGNALLEGVECFDQLGDAAGAQRLLDHAASVPSLSAQAAKLSHDRSGKKAAETSGDAPPVP